MADRPTTPLLDTVSTPADLRKLDPKQGRQLADELRVFCRVLPCSCRADDE